MLKLVCPDEIFILSWFLNYKSELNKWIKIGVPVLVTDNCVSEEYQDMLGHLANIQKG